MGVIMPVGAMAVMHAKFEPPRFGGPRKTRQFHRHWPGEEKRFEDAMAPTSGQEQAKAQRLAGRVAQIQRYLLATPYRHAQQVGGTHLVSAKRYAHAPPCQERGKTMNG
jgi:hypothetical protein